MAQTHYRKQINAFAQSLRQEERAQGTIENYHTFTHFRFKYYTINYSIVQYCIYSRISKRASSL